MIYLLLVFYVHELSIDNVVLGFGFLRALSAVGRTLLTTRRRRLAGRLVHRLGQLVARRLELRRSLVNLVDTAFLHRFLGLIERVFHRLGIGRADFIAMLL